MRFVAAFISVWRDLARALDMVDAPEYGKMKVLSLLVRV
jgi:hypothetical protein